MFVLSWGNFLAHMVIKGREVYRLWSATTACISSKTGRGFLLWLILINCFVSMPFRLPRVCCPKLTLKMIASPILYRYFTHA